MSRRSFAGAIVAALVPAVAVASEKKTEGYIKIPAILLSATGGKPNIRPGIYIPLDAPDGGWDAVLARERIYVGGLYVPYKTPTVKLHYFTQEELSKTRCAASFFEDLQGLKYCAQFSTKGRTDSFFEMEMDLATSMGLTNERMDPFIYGGLCVRP